MATYLELQSKNVRNSFLLTGVIAALTVTAGGLIGGIWGGTQEAMLIGIGVAAVITLVQALVAFSAGADIVLSIHGAKEVDDNNLEFRQLYNIVEEMKIASRLPMPRVYVIHDHSPNAFATGKNPEDGRVAVTTGLMEILDRDELQGVIAHELAHIRNKDILFQTVVGIMVGTIVILSDVMLHSFLWGGGRRRGGSSDDNKGAAVMMIIGLVFAIIAPIMAQFVRMAISRQREYLADATGAQFTRYPQALASALNKIATAGIPLKSANRGTEHMFISPPKANFSASMSTHPPIADRIARLNEIGNSYARNENA